MQFTCKHLEFSFSKAQQSHFRICLYWIIPFYQNLMHENVLTSIRGVLLRRVQQYRRSKIEFKSTLLWRFLSRLLLLPPRRVVELSHYRRRDHPRVARRNSCGSIAISSNARRANEWMRGEEWSHKTSVMSLIISSCAIKKRRSGGKNYMKIIRSDVRWDW